MTDSPARPFVRIMPTPDLNYDLAQYLLPSSVQRANFSRTHYRCLPLNAANSVGWTLYNPFPFTAIWKGGNSREDVEIQTEGDFWAYSWFGHATFTIYPRFVVQTAPGVNLWVRPVANHWKLPVLTMEGLVETDWLKQIFTLNFRLMLPRISASYAVGEPLVEFVPYGRHFVENFDAEIVRSGADYDERIRQVDELHAKRVARIQNKDMFDLDYMRGIDTDGAKVEDHQPRIKTPPFREVTPEDAP